MLQEKLEAGIYERGNYAFRNENGSAVLFAKVDEDYWLQAAFTPMNYPAWNISMFYGTEEEMIGYIHENLGGWIIDKTQCDLNEEDGRLLYAYDIVENIVKDVCHHIDCHNCKLATNDKAIDDAISTSAMKLRYLISRDMRQEIYEEIFENCDLIVDN